jgi:hypothetical protein
VTRRRPRPMLKADPCDECCISEQEAIRGAPGRPGVPQHPAGNPQPRRPACPRPVLAADGGALALAVSGVLFVLYPAVRIPHGVLVAAGSIWLALAVASGTGEGVGVRRCRLCLGFAGVSAWQVAAGPIGQPEARQRYAAYASGLAIMGVLVLVLKLAGAAVALAAVLVRPGLPRRPPQLLGVALWGAFGLLSLYSAGNLAITVGTVSSLLPPPAAAGY